MRLRDFDYHLPPELIAQQPIRPRDHSRLLLLNRKTGEIKHQHFYDIINYLQSGDLLILNNSKVFPARLIGHKKNSGGQVEIFLHRQQPDNYWECLLRGKIKVGLVIDFPGQLQATVMEDNQDGTWRVKFNLEGKKFWSVINKIGLVPLPPYIKRNKKRGSDQQNYQTVFADDHKIGSVAAPTAGFHFTPALLKRIKSQGVKIAFITLHVGLGTFAPVKTEKIEDHRMHSEFVEIKSQVVKDILTTKKQGGRIIAVGTTSCRSLESLDLKKQSAQIFWTNIFIYPGYRFRTVDALITNFHLPKSSLLMLVSALAGKTKIDRAYQEAISQKYRFFSYGDAMFIY